MNITQLTDLYGIGPATAETLDEYGIADAADLVRTYLGSDGTPRKVKLIRETVSAKTMSQAIHRADVRNNDLVMGVENDRYSMVRQMAFVRQFHLSTNYVTDPPEPWLRSGGTQDQTYIHGRYPKIIDIDTHKHGGIASGQDIIGLTDDMAAWSTLGYDVTEPTAIERGGLDDAVSGVSRVIVTGDNDDTHAVSRDYVDGVSAFLDRDVTNDLSLVRVRADATEDDIASPVGFVDEVSDWTVVIAPRLDY